MAGQQMLLATAGRPRPLSRNPAERGTDDTWARTVPSALERVRACRGTNLDLLGQRAPENRRALRERDEISRPLPQRIDATSHEHGILSDRR